LTLLAACRVNFYDAGTYLTAAAENLQVCDKKAGAALCLWSMGVANAAKTPGVANFLSLSRCNVVS